MIDTAPRRLELIALDGIPIVQAGDDLAAHLLAAIVRAELVLEDRDVIVVAQKIVSKAESRRVRLSSVEPSARALELAPQLNKDPRLVEIVLRESREVLRVRSGVVVVEDIRGLVLANAGVDASNVNEDGGEDSVGARGPSRGLGAVAGGVQDDPPREESFRRTRLIARAPEN